MARSNIWEEECQCGCGGIPKTGLWLAGHNATHRSRLVNRVRYYADWDAADELIRRGWLDHVTTVAEMVEGLARQAELTAPLH